MGKIHVLEKQVAELIAAGEVVERPASIVKELLENAIDAGASSITVEIRGGGIRYIRITDNGCGIEREDVSRAFVRHATSKVRSSDDLNNILTMGFRGEALASIAAMAKVELVTRTAEELAGTRCVVNGGEQVVLDDIGCPVGTIITVQDVFYNTPARMKFLKKDVTEGNSVQAVVEKAALAEPGILFRFIRDGAVKMKTPGDGKLLSAVRSIFGKDFSEKVVAVHYQYEGLAVDGFICKPEIAKASRTMQNFFINRRFVRSKTCMAALEEAYKNAVMVGKYPSCVLNLTIPPQIVDVNVHPAKTEVRFSSEKDIFSLVYYGCKTALGAARLTPEIDLTEKRFNPFQAQVPEKAPQQERMDAATFRSVLEISKDVPVAVSAKQYRAIDIERTEAPPPAGNEMVLHSPKFEYCLAETVPTPPVFSREFERSNTPPSVAYSKTANAGDSPPKAPKAETLLMEQPRFSRPAASRQVAAPEPSVREEISPNPDETGVCDCNANELYSDMRVIGEVFSTYIVLQSQGELVFVDKHAAHERLLYNQLMRQGMGEARQLLLSPITVRLSMEEYSAVLENLATMEQAGILLEDFGENCLLVREVSPILAELDVEALVTEFAQKLLRGNNRLVTAQLEHFFHVVACRAAVKAGDRLELPSLEQLIQLLREDTDTAHCPHGRPVAVRMTKYALEKRFGRLG